MMASKLLSPTRRIWLRHNPHQLFSKALSARSLSSISEPNPTLFPNDFVFQAVEKPVSDVSDTLRTDVRTMGSLLGQHIQNSIPNVFPQVEELRSLTKQWSDPSASPEEKSSILTSINTLLQSLSEEELRGVAKSFSHFLALANTAERHHRVRILRSRGSDGCTSDRVFALPPKHDSCGGVLYDLVANGTSPEKVYETLINQTVEIVLTAHPTEVNRPTIMSKHERLFKHLAAADELRARGAAGEEAATSPYNKRRLNDALMTEISLLWQSSKVSPEKPTPVDEARRGTLVVERTLWHALPQFLRKLDATMEDALGKRLPLDANILKFASWMGGDRDGNPNVTPNVTREVCLQNRSVAASLLGRDLDEVHKMLSLKTCGEEIEKVVGKDAFEPYREYLTPIIEKLKRTENWANDSLSSLKQGLQPPPIPESQIYLTKSALLSDLLPIHSSLVSTNNQILADGLLTDVIRRVVSFGLTFLPLDVRQESDRHEEALDCITRYLGLGRYAEWDEKTRLLWLQKEITARRPLIRRGEWNDHPEIFTATAVDTLETFTAIAEQREGSLGSYVISQATSASDVLAVLLLQLDAGVKNPLPVSPLFETLSDLEGAYDTMETLFTTPAYMGMINGKQEVMIGYSDSAKDAGRLAASWAQYQTQEALANLAKKHNIDITFFHGKGGTVGRGGNPATFKAIMAKAPGTVNSRFRVTEQGEMITQNFGHGVIAERSMDIFTAAVLAEALTPRPSPPEEWRRIMARLSEVSCEAYRQVVRKDERFVSYFRTATPELELARLNIGSRPAKRKVGGGVESLRAIPWIFAWMQNRLNMPSWLGVGEAIDEVLKSEDGDELRRMYEEWEQFRTVTHLVEMVLAKSSPEISQNYEDNLITDPHLKSLGTLLREKHALTKQAIMDITGHETLSEDNPLLMRLLKVRNPYVYSLNVIQAEVLKRLREQGDSNKVLEDALGITITGIANGMGNTG